MIRGDSSNVFAKIYVVYLKIMLMNLMIIDPNNHQNENLCYSTESLNIKGLVTTKEASLVCSTVLTRMRNIPIRLEVKVTSLEFQPKHNFWIYCFKILKE